MSSPEKKNMKSNAVLLYTEMNTGSINLERKRPGICVWSNCLIYSMSCNRPYVSYII